MSNMKNGNEPCFPQEGAGLTKREYFAAMAMQGFLSNSPDWDAKPIAFKFVSKLSVSFADALLAELEKPTEQ